MTKTVFDSSMCVHVWAQQTQHTGRNDKASISFDGPTLYSYRADIARFHDVTTESGEATKVCLLSNDKWSVTTTHHQSMAYNAVHGVKFCVPSIGVYIDHSKNLACLTGHIDIWVKRYSSPRYSVMIVREECAGYTRDLLLSAIAKVTDYARVFGLAAPELESADTYAARVVAAHTTRAERAADPKVIAKRERARARRLANMTETQRRAAEMRAAGASRWQIKRMEREAASAKYAAEYDEMIARWMTGESATCPHSWDKPVVLRVKNNELQTSQGASVPLAHAIKVFQFVKLCRERGEPWKRNGHTIRVGHFTVDEVRPDGSFRAGCHDIGWAEIERIAVSIGVFDSVATADALESTH